MKSKLFYSKHTFLIFIIIFLFLIYIPTFKNYAIPSLLKNEYINSEDIQIFKHKYGFIISSNGESENRLCYIDKADQNVVKMTTLPNQYTSIVASVNYLYTIYNNTIGSTPCLTLQNYTLSSFNKEPLITKRIKDMQITSSSSIISDKNDQLYIINNNNTSEILQYEILTSTVPNRKIELKEHNITKLCSNMSGSRIYALTDKGNYCFQKDTEPVKLSETVSNLNSFEFIDDNTIITPNGDIYKCNNKDGINFEYSFSTLSNTTYNIKSCVIDSGIVTTIKDNLLYLLDYNNGEPISQYNFNGKLLGMSYLDNTIILITSYNDNIYYEFIDSTSFEHIPCDTVELSASSLTKDEILEFWNNSLPSHKNDEPIFKSQPDISNFSSLGTISQTVLDDGVNSINFYRNLYGVNPITVDISEPHIAQKAAMMLAHSYNNVKPENMNEEFYNDSMKGISDGYIISLNKSTYSPICQAIHILMNSNYDFRHKILYNNLSTIDFGLATNLSGETIVVVYVNNTSLSNYTSYPIVGLYPYDLINSNTVFDITLPQNVSSGKRGNTVVNVTDNLNTNCSIDILNGLNIINNKTLTFCLPNNFNISETSKLNFIIGGIYNNLGEPIKVSYSIELFKLPEIEPDTPDIPDQPVEYDFSSSKYKIDYTSGIITGIEPGTSVTNFKKNLNVKGYSIKIKNLSNEETTRGYVGTGWDVEILKNSDFYDKFTIIIYGDLNGNGKINSTDANILYNYLLGNSSLDGYFFLAADVNHDNIVNVQDLLLIDKYIDGISSIIQ